MKFLSYKKSLIFPASLFLLAGIFCILFLAPLASAKSLNLSVKVYICNNDGICDTGQGEDYLNCLNDCPAPVCNDNNVCEPGLGETNGNCPNDCHLPVCNDNHICEPGLGENSSNCNDCRQGGLPLVLSADNKPPIISRISVFSISRTDANISWQTDESAYCQLDWGDSSEYKSGSTAEISFLTEHATELPNLNPGTDYYFQISCYDHSQNLGRVTNEQFATLPPSLQPFVTGKTTSTGGYSVLPVARPPATVSATSPYVGATTTQITTATSGAGLMLTSTQSVPAVAEFSTNTAKSVKNVNLFVFGQKSVSGLFSRWWWLVSAVILVIFLLFVMLRL